MRILPSLLFVALVSACGRPEQPPVTDAANAVAVHERVLALDTHVDIPLDFATDAADPLNFDGQVNLQKMRAGGLDAAFFIVYVGQTPRTPENYAQAKLDAMTKFDAIHRMADELYPDRIGLAYSPADVTDIVASGRLAAVIGIENGYVIGTDLDLIDRYFELGARYMTLVHNGHNDIGDSAQPRPAFGDGETEHGGLSEFGAAVVERMNEVGMMVDVSHASKQTALDAIRLSRAPVIASHSSVSGVAQHVRNMDDETLSALAANGGVIQIVAFPSYLLVQPPEREAAMRALEARLGLSGPTDPAALDDDLRQDYLIGIRDIQRQWREPDVTDLVDHIDYAVQRIGVDHVGISSDFGGGGGIIGWSDAAETGNVTAELLARGYSERDIAKIWSGNLLRVWSEVAAVAETL
jgi:membrane dipeptidase